MKLKKLIKAFKLFEWYIDEIVVNVEESNYVTYKIFEEIPKEQLSDKVIGWTMKSEKYGAGIRLDISLKENKSEVKGFSKLQY